VRDDQGMLKRATLVAVLLWTMGLPSAAAQGRAPEPGYLDDRSTPEAVISSYYDAVNRHEYARAYSYWEPAAAEREVAPFDDFVSGYADTASVEVTLGEGVSGVGAGQLYFSVPVTLVATMTDGSLENFVGCYTLHLARPELQAIPPYRPLSIQHANIAAVDGADAAGLMAQLCPPV
jgi:hypothetical protein